MAARCHDCTAVAADTALQESSDAAGEPVQPLIYTSDATFPRDRLFIGRLITALEHVCNTDAVAVTGGVL